MINKHTGEKIKVAVAGTGYVGLSLAVLLAQYNHVTAVDIVPEKVEKINNRISTIQDKEIEEYLAGKDLDLTATLDGKSAYADADFVIIAAPTNYRTQKQRQDSYSHKIYYSGRVYGIREKEIQYRPYNFQPRVFEGI